jgi:hypothetical protein
MIFSKKSKMKPNLFFCQNLRITFNAEKRATSVIFTKLPKVNNRPKFAQSGHSIAMFPLKPYTLAGLEPGFSVPESDARPIEPRRAMAIEWTKISQVCS